MEERFDEFVKDNRGASYEVIKDFIFQERKQWEDELQEKIIEQKNKWNLPLEEQDSFGKGYISGLKFTLSLLEYPKGYVPSQEKKSINYVKRNFGKVIKKMSME